MSIKLYDDALYEKIQKWVVDSSMRILRPEETTRLFQLKADLNKDDSISLPLIALSRDKDIEILNVQKQVKTFRGFAVDSNAEYTMSLDVIPIQIGYQLDIYTQKMEEADNYIRNFVFNFINYPKLKVEIPYNGAHLTHNANIWIDSNVSDNSDIRERLFSDQFTRFTIKLVVDDAYLFSVPVKKNTQLVYTDLVVNEDNDGEILEVKDAE